MRRPARQRAVGAALGVTLDRLLPEPPGAVHPVALFGLVMTGLERRIHRDRRGPGVVHALGGVALGLGAGALVRSTAAATTSAVAGRALDAAAVDVRRHLETGDLAGARAALPALVGRDPRDLGADDIARAVVESVAENTVDAVVAPAFWGAVGGAPGALAYRAVNTLDAMVGHRSPRYVRYGWASARLDDVAAWVPARLTAVLVALVRPRRARAVWTAVRTQAPAHPSPNAGVAEAAFAAALGVRLGGTNRYGDRVEEGAPLGQGRPPGVSDIGEAVHLARLVDGALVVGLLLVAGAGWAIERKTRRARARSADRGRPA